MRKIILANQTLRAWFKQAGPTSKSIVKSLPGIKVRIIDPETGNDLVPGQVGEIWIKGTPITGNGPNKMIPAEKTISRDWYRSGYIGCIEKDGGIHVRLASCTDRASGDNRK